MFSSFISSEWGNNREEIGETPPQKSVDVMRLEDDGTPLIVKEDHRGEILTLEEYLRRRIKGEK